MSAILEGLVTGNDILTQNGYIGIEELKEKDTLLSCCGFGNVMPTKIRSLKKEKYSGPIVEISIEGRKKIKVLPKQVCFSKFDTSGTNYFITLIKREKTGWRIGQETDIRGLNKHHINYEDKHFILDICHDETEANFMQHIYSYKYGIPMADFEAKNDKFSFPQEMLDRIFKIIPTEERAVQILEDLNMYKDYPYFIAPNKQFGTRLLTLIMFGNKELEEDDRWHPHRIFVNIDHNKINFGKTSLLDPANKSAWNINTTRKDYDEIVNFANVLASFEDLEIIMRSQLTPSTPFFFFPASHIRRTMQLAVFNRKEKVLKEKYVEKVQIKDYSGDVFNVEVENLRNCIINDIAVYT